MLWHGAVLIRNGDSDVRRGCRLRRVLRPSGAPPSNRNAAFGAHVFWYSMGHLTLQGGLLQLSWTLSDFSEVSCYLHSFWLRSPRLPVTSLPDTSEQPRSGFNVRQMPCSRSLEYTVSIWQGYQVLRAGFFFLASFPSNRFAKGCRNHCDFCHLCSSRALTSGSVVVSATGSKPRVLSPAGAQGFPWGAMNELGPRDAAEGL